jgi:hypothetical protein
MVTGLNWMEKGADWAKLEVLQVENRSKKGSTRWGYRYIQGCFMCTNLLNFGEVVGDLYHV